MMQYMIGADPELFVMNNKGEYRSAHNLIPGSKHDPHPVLNGFIQPDGVAAEFNIMPAVTAEEFTGYIRDVLGELSDRINSKHSDLKLIARPTATFNAKYFKKLPGKAKLLGCEPDANAWTGKTNPAPYTPKPFRTGAGHIHLGWTEGESPTDTAHVTDCVDMTKQLDAALYFTSLLWDDDGARRELYGRMGTYRAKPYGVEYRPLSNAWIADPDLHIWIFNATLHAAEMFDANEMIYRDKTVSNLISKELETRNPGDRYRMIEHHDMLVEDFGFPKLPEAYTRLSH